MKLRIAGITDDSIVDGKGFRLTLFTQGCPHNCPGCHNPKTHSFDGGRETDTEEIIERLNDNPLLDGITFSGGEPFCQPEPLAEIARQAHEMGLNVWTYSGWTFEELINMPEAKPLLDETDVLVDGPYIEAERTLSAAYRGSKNQRIIDIKKSIDSGAPVVLEY